MSDFKYCKEAIQVAKEKGIDLKKFSNKPLESNEGLKNKGAEIVRAAKAENSYRKNLANGEIHQMTKDLADHICFGGGSRVLFLPRKVNPKFRPKETGKWEFIKGKLVKVK